MCKAAETSRRLRWRPSAHTHTHTHAQALGIHAKLSAAAVAESGAWFWRHPCNWNITKASRSVFSPLSYRHSSFDLAAERQANEKGESSISVTGRVVWPIGHFVFSKVGVAVLLLLHSLAVWFGHIAEDEDLLEHPHWCSGDEDASLSCHHSLLAVRAEKQPLPEDGTVHTKVDVQGRNIFLLLYIQKAVI